jgi:cytosine/uracil/thiamine/allantoin permease
MTYLFFLFGVVLIAAGGVFYSEQLNPPGDLTDLSPVAFLFGLLVRIALTVVALSMSALLLASIWGSA